MPRRKVAMPYHPPTQSPLSPLETRWGLMTYTLSRVPARKLPLLVAYALTIVKLADHGWISRESLGKGGGSIVGVLSMVSGLLLSYRFSSAIGKWDEGKQVWSEVRTTIRDGIRMLSALPSGTVKQLLLDGYEGSPDQERKDKQKLISQRIDELSGLLVSFAFALQHNLQGTRPLPQAPLCDLLPSGYLSSLKRTEARVRFAESHAGPSGSRSNGPESGRNKDSSTDQEESDQSRELRSLAFGAEEAIGKLSKAATTMDPVDTYRNEELQQQLSQLNFPDDSVELPSQFSDRSFTFTTSEPSKPPKSNLHSPNPPNLALAILKLMEVYIEGMRDIPEDEGGWDLPRRERGFNLVKALSGHLGKAERLCSNPPPLPLTLHLSHLLVIYLAALPCSLLCVVDGWLLVLITLIAGWCLLGLEALIGEVSGVFGLSENHHPLPIFTEQILSESLDISPPFLRYYKARVIARVGRNTKEVLELDRRGRKGAEDWVPSFK
ncbi:hypothetical protein I352_05236 [Cryptococcus deuterogattii MMRL2647]|nr:hypothetical protein I352_05236 [Cryptococcus deuterogattii MMRL2647]